MCQTTLKIGVLIYTFNRTDDARINMEIIRRVWKEIPLFQDTIIVHSFNGNRQWWTSKFLEDHTLYLENKSHYIGAANLMDAGIEIFRSMFPSVDYIIVAASDFWIVKPENLTRIILNMKENKKYLATSGWGYPVKYATEWKDAATDFYIIDAHWAYEMNLFPLRYEEFLNAYQEVIMYNNGDPRVYLEGVFLLRFKQAVMRSCAHLKSENLLPDRISDCIYHIKEREPIITLYAWNGKRQAKRETHWPDLGMFSEHDLLEKQKILRSYKLDLGEEGNRLRDSNDISYFNHHLEN